MTLGPESFRLTAVTIACTDLARSEQFYRDILGATAEPRDGYGCKWFRLGSQLINLMPNAVKKCPAEFPTNAMPILWLDPDGLVLEIWKAAPAG